MKKISLFDHCPPDSDVPTAGFLAGFFRRLLCGDHPRRYVPREFPSHDGNSAKTQNAMEKSSKPGVVARLMGLESMPESSPFAGRAPVGLIRRSRSVNSLGDWPEFLSHKHVRNKTCSFHEVPVFLQQENEDFLLLSFRDTDNGLKKGFVGSNRLEAGKNSDRLGDSCEVEFSGRRVADKRLKKSEVKEGRSKVLEEKKRVRERKFFRESRDSKHEKWGFTSNKESGENRLFLTEKEGSSSGNKKKIAGNEKLGKKRGSADHSVAVESSQVGCDSNCSSENSSPVSVLDLHFEMETEFQTDSAARTLDSRPTPLDLRLKLPSNIAKPEHPSNRPEFGLILNSSKNGLRSIYKEDRSPELCPRDNRELKLWSDISRSGQEDIKNGDWVSREKGKLLDSKDIGIEVGLQILDHLLQEAVAELSYISAQISGE